MSFAADQLTPHCPRDGAFCETCGATSLPRGRVRDTPSGPACLVQCATCAATPLVLTPAAMALLVAEHRTHMTTTNDRNDEKESS